MTPRTLKIGNKMKAEEIRKIEIVEGVGYMGPTFSLMQQQTKLLQEIAAQLAELNEQIPQDLA
jgi:hypothetical protein